VTGSWLVIGRALHWRVEHLDGRELNQYVEEHTARSRSEPRESVRQIHMDALALDPGTRSARLLMPLKPRTDTIRYAFRASARW
jgi:hypothetical protein